MWAASKHQFFIVLIQEDGRPYISFVIHARAAGLQILHSLTHSDSPDENMVVQYRKNSKFYVATARVTAQRSRNPRCLWSVYFAQNRETRHLTMG